MRGVIARREADEDAVRAGREIGPDEEVVRVVGVVLRLPGVRWPVAIERRDVVAPDLPARCIDEAHEHGVLHRYPRIRGDPAV